MLTFAALALAALPPLAPQGGDEQIGPPSYALALLQNGNETGPPSLYVQAGTDSLPPAMTGPGGAESLPPVALGPGGEENLPPVAAQHGEEKAPPKRVALAQVGGSEEIGPPSVGGGSEELTPLTVSDFAQPGDVDPLVLEINGFAGPGGSEEKGPPAQHATGANTERGPPVPTVAVFVGRSLLGSFPLTPTFQEHLTGAGFDIEIHGATAGAFLGDPNGEEVGTLPAMAGPGGPGFSSQGKGDTYRTDWTTSDGLTHSVITAKRPLEGMNGHAWRHGARVAAALNNFPSAGAASLALPDPDALVTSWTSGNGMLTHTVPTTQKPGESNEDWAKRHKKRVDALLEIFPADV